MNRQKTIVLPLLLVALLLPTALSLLLADEQQQRPQPQLEAVGDDARELSATGETVDAERERNVRSLWAKLSQLLDWKQYRRRFNKSYQSLAEQTRRFAHYLANSLRVLRHLVAYQTGRSSYYLTLNRLSDQTREERRQRFPLAGEDTELLREDVRSRPPRRVRRSLMSLMGKIGAKNKMAIDWRGDDCWRERISDQLDCGCCYAMSTVRVLEWRHCRRASDSRAPRSDGAKVKFSEQFLVDCGRPAGLAGCESGSLAGLRSFLLAFGLLDGRRLPFNGRENDCLLDGNPDHPGEPNERALLARDTVRVEQFETKWLRDPSGWSAALAQGPLTLLLYTPEDFSDYAGGLYTCDYGLEYKRWQEGARSPQEANSWADWVERHFIVIAGSGQYVRDNFWLLANSFGDDWGEKGYMRMAQAGGCTALAVQMTTRFAP